ncbi:hypothetical protein AA958_19280 [Streptomyces sp. CNQ-509]|uniref:hypothetical protein n=1 Tax=Streptomyces sp. CNQ-509 TaxID=444103 RepID=UPI00062DECA0|nr:hypothetical protein [Streptomyces sp. CNQ-509]AKH83971.1 hypothetical protein AA958_19280 [Streptomyces sp. CNQ-509]
MNGAIQEGSDAISDQPRQDHLIRDQQLRDSLYESMFTFTKGSTVLPKLFGGFQYSTAPSTSQAPLLNRAAAKAVLSDLPGDPVVLLLDTLVMVAQSHDGRHITWRELASVKLGVS